MKDVIDSPEFIESIVILPADDAHGIKITQMYGTGTVEDLIGEYSLELVLDISAEIRFRPICRFPSGSYMDIYDFGS
jgi:hypothetical protein